MCWQVLLALGRAPCGVAWLRAGHVNPRVPTHTRHHMATIVDSLIELFGTPDADTTPDALQQHIRDQVNADTAGEIHLSDEIEIGRDRFNELYAGGDYDPRHAPDMRMLTGIVTALQAVKTEQEEARAELDTEFATAAATMGGAPTPNDPADQDNSTHAQDQGEPGEPEPGPAGEPATEPADQDNSTHAQDQDEPGESGEPNTPEPVAAAARTRVRPAATPVRLPSTGDLNAYRAGGGEAYEFGRAHV